QLLLHDRVVAVGETGLDFYRDRASREAQRRLLSLQLDLARDVGLPVVVHCRYAEQEMEEALAAFEGTVILHCFSSPELLAAALAAARGDDFHELSALIDANATEAFALP